jgi:localization factor PodJL
MFDSEDRAQSRVTEAISSIMQRLTEVEEHSAEAIAPVQKAVTGVAAKLEKYESARDDDDISFDTMQTPSRRTNDFSGFGGPAAPLTPEPPASPLNAAQPARAAPLPPRMPVAHDTHNDDIYFAEEIDDLMGEDTHAASPPPMEAVPFEVMGDDDVLIEDQADTEFAAPPPEDDDPFWTPDVITPAAPLAATPSDTLPPMDHVAFDDDEPLFGDDDDHIPLAHNAPETAPLVAEAPLHLDALPAPEAEPTPPGKNDYLAQARKAAQAQSAPAKQKEKPAKEAKIRGAATSEAPKLRGSSRVVLWGSAGMIALALMGGAWYFGGRPTAPQPAPRAPEPAAAPQTIDQAPPAQDPFAQQTQSATADTAAPTPTPGAHAAPSATTQPAVVAGPLPARSVNLDNAAQAGDVVAQYELGLQKLSGGRTQDGIMLLRRAADRGLAMAQYRMAKLYERGEGVPTDLNVARQWTERAAAAGNRRAMHDLGVYFARGEGAPLDEGAAFRWFRQAAELGVADSQYNLGVLYQQGRGVGASPSEALFWFSIAARQGDTDAAAHATALEAQLSPQQVQQAHARAEAFRPRAASAIANGDFGARPWSTATVAQR